MAPEDSPIGFVKDSIDSFTGKSGEDAAKDAANAQVAANNAALAQSERLNKPYVDLGVNNMPGYSAILGDPAYNTFDKLNKDPYGYNYLSANPLFNASVENANRTMSAAGAAAGKFNSGGMVDQLFQNYLATGDAFWGNYLTRSDALANSAQQRAYQPIQLGQSAAAGQAVNAGNLLTASGDAMAAGIVGGANARAGGVSNMLNLGGQIAGAVMGMPSGGGGQVLPNTPSGFTTGYDAPGSAGYIAF